MALCKQIFAQVYVIRVCNIISLIQMSVTGRRYLLVSFKAKQKLNDDLDDFDNGVMNILNDEGNLRRDDESESEDS